MDDRDIQQALQRLLAQLPGQAQQAEAQMAQAAVPHVQERAPVVTGRLRDGLHVEGDAVVSDAPYSTAVELDPEGRGYGFFTNGLADAAEDALAAAQEVLHG